MHREIKQEIRKISNISVCVFCRHNFRFICKFDPHKNLVGLCTGTALGLIVGAVIDIYQNKNEQ